MSSGPVPWLLWASPNLSFGEGFFAPQLLLRYHQTVPTSPRPSQVLCFRMLVLHFPVLYSFITSCCKVLASPNCNMAWIHLYSFSGNIPACCSPPFLGLRLHRFCNFSWALCSRGELESQPLPIPTCPEVACWAAHQAWICMWSLDSFEFGASGKVVWAINVVT